MVGGNVSGIEVLSILLNLWYFVGFSRLGVDLDSDERECNFYRGY